MYNSAHQKENWRSPGCRLKQAGASCPNGYDLCGWRRRKDMLGRHHHPHWRLQVSKCGKRNKQKHSHRKTQWVDNGEIKIWGKITSQFIYICFCSFSFVYWVLWHCFTDKLIWHEFSHLLGWTNSPTSPDLLVLDMVNTVHHFGLWFRFCPSQTR